jgi:hypothetical protein
MPRSSLLPMIALLFVAPGATAQSGAAFEAAPIDLIRRAVQNEIAASRASSPKYLFQSHKQTPQGSQTKLMVQTQQAMAGLVISYNDQPLNSETRRTEEARVERFVKDPAELGKKQRTERDEAERSLQIMKALPDAFLYESDGREPSRPGVGKPGDELRRLRFRPNPKYEPPSRVEQILTGMHGYVLVDAKSERMARIEGTLFKEVGFGWGILGHLDPGGRIEMNQAVVDGETWRITELKLVMNGKLLLFKTIAVNSTESFSSFQRVADRLTFAQGLDLLKREAARLQPSAGWVVGQK